MHKLLLILGVLPFLCACGGGGDAPPPSIDGKWSAVSQAVGSSLTLQLTSQNGTVAGAGAYTVEAGASGVLAIAGTYQPPVAALSFTYDNGNSAVYAATLTDASHMSGKLRYQDGTTVDLPFVRQ
ncbi:MAG: hypothetical protein ACXWJM_01095 [Ramlibacter sp.]